MAWVFSWSYCFVFDSLRNMLALLVVVSLVTTIFAEPPCQYGIFPTSPLIFALNACNGETNGYNSTNTSLQYVCNETLNGINLIQYDDYYCNGNQVSIQDVTDQFEEFNCALPKCNDNDPIIEFVLYSNCTTKIGDRITFLADQCRAADGPGGGVKYTCNDSPPSVTYTLYETRKDCTGMFTEQGTMYDGCNFNETKIYIQKCTKPTNISLN